MSGTITPVWVAQVGTVYPEIKEPSIVYSEDIFNNENIYPDSDLEDWTENARTQAEKYSKMPFSQFAKNLSKIIKETGNVIIMAILYSISAIGGTGVLISAFPWIEFSTEFKIALFISIVMLLLWLTVYTVVYKESNPKNN